MSMKEFTKYKDRGPYHYKWYKENKFGYKDHVNKVIEYITEPGSVLDIGCGDGCVSNSIHEVGKSKSILGIDTNSCGIAQAIIHNKEHMNKTMRFRECSVYDIDTDNRFDYVIAHDVIEHLVRPEDAIAVMNKLFTKFCLITTPDAKKADLSAYDYQLWDAAGIKDLFKGYKYECERAFDTFFIKLMR